MGKKKLFIKVFNALLEESFEIFFFGSVSIRF